MKETLKSTKGRFRSYFRVLKLVWEASPSYMLLAILLQVVSSAIPPVQIWTSKIIIDRVSEALQLSPQDAAFDWHSVLVPIGIIFGVVEH